MARAVGIVITLGVILLFLTDEFIADVRLLDQLELKTYDMRLRALPRSAPQHVTIAAIDEKSLAKIGRWPWSRSTWAELVRRIDQAGARVIAFDIFFPERESAGADAQFARSISQTKKVVLGTLFLFSREEVRHLGEKSIEAAMEALAPQAIADIRAPAGADFKMAEPFGVIGNIPELQKSAAHTGHLNVFPDTDGVVRRMPLVTRHNGRYFAAFDVQAARMYARDAEVALDLEAYGVAGIKVASRGIPLDEEGRLLVRYRGPEGTFDTVSLADILEQKADARLLRDRIVLIGNTAKGIGDVRVTPYGATFPGVEVRANIIESLLEGNTLHRPEWMTFVDAGGMLALAVIMIALLPRLGVSGGAILAALLLAGYLFLATTLFRSEGLWLNVVYPTMLVALLFVSTALVFYFFAFSEKRYLKLAFQHYVPPAVVDDLVAGADTLRLGGEKRDLTVLFSDIRGFTSLSEALDPEALVHLLNEYFTAMTDKVFENGGSLDKYIGDAIMAVYGAPVGRREHAALACRSALGMLDVLDELQKQWQGRGLPPLGIGVGINTGQMIVGNMGSAERFNYTVVGDAVNLASRIENKNKDYGTSILISEYTYDIVKDEFTTVREVDVVRVRGRQQPVRLYELMRPERFRSITWFDEYHAAYNEMRDGERTKAHDLFTSLHARSGDPVSGYHARITKYPARRQVD